MYMSICTHTNYLALCMLTADIKLKKLYGCTSDKSVIY